MVDAKRPFRYYVEKRGKRYDFKKTRNIKIDFSSTGAPYTYLSRFNIRQPVRVHEYPVTAPTHETAVCMCV